MIDHGAVEWTSNYLASNKKGSRDRINSANSGVSGWRGFVRDFFRAIQVTSAYDDYVQCADAELGLEAGNFKPAIQILKEDALRLSLQINQRPQNLLDIPAKTKAKLMGNVVRRLEEMQEY